MREALRADEGSTDEAQSELDPITYHREAQVEERLQLLLALTQHRGGVLAQDLGCSQRAERQSPSQ